MNRTSPAQRMLISCGCYFGICLLYVPLTGNFLAAGQALNIVLAALPLCFALGLCRSRKKPVRALLAALWLLFLPNAFYLLTDLVHMPVLEWRGADGAMRYAHDAAGWVLTLLFGVGAALGAFAGLMSMRICRKELLGGKSRQTVRLCGGAVMLLSGFGVYIGRFLRLNSWDVVNPVRLMHTILSQLDLFALQMTLSFAAAVFLLWLCYDAAAPREE